jgi:hypothetical protein
MHHSLRSPASIRGRRRTFRRLAAAALLAALPSLAAAQRGQHPVRGGRDGAVLIGDPAPTLEAADVARLNPIAMLITQGRDVGLSDSLTARLDSIRRDLTQRNLPALSSLDSLLSVMRRDAADSSGTEGDRLMRAGDRRQSFAMILGRIRDNDDEAALQAMELFSGRRLRWAFSVVQQQRALMRVIAHGGTARDR